MPNHVFIAISIDGYIADAKGGIDWLDSVPHPAGTDMGYTTMMARTDALVMGKNTFEKVLSFGIDWPYTLPVVVLSHSMKQPPASYENKIQMMSGSPQQVTRALNQMGYLNLYIDGGSTVQQFLQADLIDEMIVTIIPILLGGGVPLFGKLKAPLLFTCTHTKRFKHGVVQHRFIRNRTKNN